MNHVWFVSLDSNFQVQTELMSFGSSVQLQHSIEPLYSAVNQVHCWELWHPRGLIFNVGNVGVVFPSTNFSWNLLETPNTCCAEITHHFLQIFWGVQGHRRPEIHRDLAMRVRGENRRERRRHRRRRRTRGREAVIARSGVTVVGRYRKFEVSFLRRRWTPSPKSAKGERERGRERRQIPFGKTKGKRNLEGILVLLNKISL